MLSTREDGSGKASWTGVWIHEQNPGSLPAALAHVGLVSTRGSDAAFVRCHINDSVDRWAECGAAKCARESVSGQAVAWKRLFKDNVNPTLQSQTIKLRQSSVIQLLAQRESFHLCLCVYGATLTQRRQQQPWCPTV